MDEVCFNRSHFNLYLVILIILFVFFVYIFFFNKTETVANVTTQKTSASTTSRDLYNCQKDLQMCILEARRRTQPTPDILLNRIYNPLVGPERVYPGGRLNARSYDEYQQIGFVDKNDERYPLYGRPKYPGRTTKYEYYIIDETRNRLKIPFKSRNDEELYDGESVFIDVLGDTFSIKIYDYDNVRYNPNF